ncbi:MAG: stage II sporulation protein M [Lachnospiraceae bacterium]|nr:stage II sporulation protein M [Lachnospiraceae bacterium]MDD6618487.1 stage II sporulation protein M [Clostridiales bacterium]MDY4769245.1 stage II sporulation protein M [Lachnospiraceae bacterium]
MKKIQPVLLAFVAGLLVGAVLPNLFEKTAWKINGLSDLMLLERCLSDSVDSRGLFLYLLEKKGSLLLLMAFLGVSVFGVAEGIVGAAVLGGFIGAILSAMLKLGGVRGFLLGLGLLLPQYLFYIPVFLLFFGACFSMSLNCWKRKHITAKEYRDYLVTVGIFWAISIAAMALESYVNPMLLKFLLKYLKFF